MRSDLIEKLARERRLELEEYEALIDGRDAEDARLLAQLGRQTAQSVYGSRVFVRGLI